MEKFKTFLYGMGTAVFAWLALIVTDAVDEYMLNESCLLGSGVFFGLPIVMLIVYIKHNLRVRPGAGRLARWFAGYYIAFLPIWYFVYLMMVRSKGDIRSVSCFALSRSSHIPHSRGDKSPLRAPCGAGH